MAVDVSPPRAIFLEDWWLDAVSGGAWESVSVETSERACGWLPFVRSRHMGFTRCGAPPLTRLLHPVVTLALDKPETERRTRLQLETELIRRLPPAAAYEFILSPHTGHALAWQSAGFDARIQPTFVIDAGTPPDVVWQQMNSKTRNVVRRAQETLTVAELSGEAFLREYVANLDRAGDEPHVAGAAPLIAQILTRGRGRAIASLDASGTTQAAVLFVWDDADYYYFLATRNPLTAPLGAVGLLVWQGIVDAGARGLRFDFDGVSSRGRLHFLQSFGGRLVHRLVVSKGSGPYELRLLLRRLRRRASGVVERFP